MTKAAMNGNTLTHTMYNNNVVITDDMVMDAAGLYSMIQKTIQERNYGRTLSFAHIKNNHGSPFQDMFYKNYGHWFNCHTEIKLILNYCKKRWQELGLGSVVFHPLTFGCAYTLSYASAENRRSLPGSGLFYFKEEHKELHFDLVDIDESIKLRNEENFKNEMLSTISKKLTSKFTRKLKKLAKELQNEMAEEFGVDPAVLTEYEDESYEALSSLSVEELAPIRAVVGN